MNLAVYQQYKDEPKAFCFRIVNALLIFTLASEAERSIYRQS